MANCQIVDVYDALTNIRPYKPAFSHDRAVSILQAEAARGLWNPEISRAFVETLHETELLARTAAASLAVRVGQVRAVE